MSLSLNAITNLSRDILHIITRECSFVLQQYQDLEDNPHELIHQIRKSFKKIRALLRLFRDSVDYYHDKNHFFRDEARRLSDVRDAEAMLEGLNMLCTQYDDHLYKNTFDKIRTMLTRYRDKLGEPVLAQGGALDTIKENLKVEMETVTGWPLDISTFEDISPGIRRVYNRGRQAARTAASTRHPDDFHEWRKRIKYLRYQIRFLNALWPGFLDSWENELHHLSNFLGTDRDLYLLDRFVREDNETRYDPNEKHLLLHLVEGHRTQLQEHAILLGKRLYVLSADDFLALLDTSWQTYFKARNQQLMPPAYLEF